MGPYLIALTVPIGALMALRFRQEVLYLFVLLIVVPVLDEVIGKMKSYVSSIDKGFATTLAFHIPHTFTVLWWGVLWMGGHQLQNASPQRVALIIAVCGLVGAISAVHSHEFIHRPCKWSILAGETSFATSGYPWLAITHPMHHAKAGIEEFGHAPRLGISFWRHLPRSYLFTASAAWRYEKRLRGYTWHNRVFRLCIVTLACLAASGVAWGRKGFLYYVGIMLISTLIVELIGYLQHYGFSRPATGKLTVLAWDSDNWLTNKLFINNPLHSSHHHRPMAWYADARMGKASLPAGYLALIWLALIPWLWFALMDKRVRQFSSDGKSVSVLTAVL